MLCTVYTIQYYGFHNIPNFLWGFCVKTAVAYPGNIKTRIRSTDTWFKDSAVSLHKEG